MLNKVGLPLGALVVVGGLVGVGIPLWATAPLESLQATAPTEPSAVTDTAAGLSESKDTSDVPRPSAAVSTAGTDLPSPEENDADVVLRKLAGALLVAGSILGLGELVAARVSRTYRFPSERLVGPPMPVWTFVRNVLVSAFVGVFGVALYLGGTALHVAARLAVAAVVAAAVLLLAKWCRLHLLDGRG